MEPSKIQKCFLVFVKTEHYKESNLYNCYVVLESFRSLFQSSYSYHLMFDILPNDFMFYLSENQIILDDIRILLGCTLLGKEPFVTVFW